MSNPQAEAAAIGSQAILEANAAVAYATEYSGIVTPAMARMARMLRARQFDEAIEAVDQVHAKLDASTQQFVRQLAVIRAPAAPLRPTLLMALKIWVAQKGLNLIVDFMPLDYPATPRVLLMCRAMAQDLLASLGLEQ